MLKNTAMKPITYHLKTATGMGLNFQDVSRDIPIQQEGEREATPAASSQQQHRGGSEGEI